MDGSWPAPAARDANGRFVAGNPGRKLGSRNRVSKRAALAILADFEANQGEVLPRTRQWFLPQYLQLIARLLPRQSEDGGLDLETVGPEEALAVVAAVRAAADRIEAGLGGVEELEAALLTRADGHGSP